MFQGKDGMQGNQCCMAASSGYKASIASAAFFSDHLRKKYGYISGTEEKWRISLISLFCECPVDSVAMTAIFKRGGSPLHSVARRGSPFTKVSPLDALTIGADSINSICREILKISILDGLCVLVLIGCLACGGRFLFVVQ